MAKRLAVLMTACWLMTGCTFYIGGSSGPICEEIVRPADGTFVSDRVALIDVKGVIGEVGSFLSDGVTAADVRERLNRAETDARVRAVVLRIDSPGGSASASDVIHRELMGFRAETKKPVVAALLGTAASGGYYVAMGADRVVAQPTCVTGSVGVIMQLANVEEMFGKIGLRTDVVKSGAMKDIGSATREMTDEERALLQEVIDRLFGRFVDVVRAGRPAMTDEQATRVTDGRIFVADQALALNMIDQVGYLDDAIDEAMKLADLKDAHVVLYRPQGEPNANIYARAQTAADGGLLEQSLAGVLPRSGPAFLYLWAPGQ